jgi:27-O-demethylrifamycin SV methyltransferase
MQPLESYTAILRELGMDVLDSSDISEQTLPTFAAWRANVDRHRTRLVELIGEESVSAFVRSTDVLESFWQDGTLGYGILAATKARSST